MDLLFHLGGFLEERLWAVLLPTEWVGSELQIAAGECNISCPGLQPSIKCARVENGLYEKGMVIV